MSRLLVCCLLLSSFLVEIPAQDVKFPEMKDIFVEFYQSEVEITDLIQQASAFVKEYYDNAENRGRLDVMIFGEKQSIFYYQDTDEILEVNSTHCLAWETDESQFFYYQMFYGWLRKKNPLIIGPSALFWYAFENKDKANYEGQADARDIKCDKFSFKVKNDKDDFQVDFYFAVADWTTPYKYGSLKVPIRIALNGESSREANSRATVNQVIDFFSFKTTVDAYSFQPPIGLGCPLRKPTKSLPEIPKVFKLSAESYDLLSAGNTDETDINFSRLWYDSIHKMARLDKYDRLGYENLLYDFNTGVTYTQKNGQTCKKEALAESIFEGYDFKLGIGYFKEPAEVLGLVGDFYYMGERRIRGINADVFEIAHQDYQVDFHKRLSKVVITVYFTKEFMAVANEGETESRVPIYIRVKAYETPKKVVTYRQYNLFGFDDVIWPEMHKSFELEKCFPLSNQKSYFLLIFKASEPLARLMEGQNDLFIERLQNRIIEYSKISEHRLPFLKADYKTTGVYVTGLMLDRPSVLLQFWSLEIAQKTIAHQMPVPEVDAKTEEACGEACIKDLLCTAFYFCNHDCFLSTENMMDNQAADRIDLGICVTYHRAERNSVASEPFLKDALANLETAVLNQNVTIRVDIDEDKHEDLPIEDIIIGDGPFSGGKSGKPYQTVFSGFQLKTKEGTTDQLDFVDTLNDCYKGCRESESMTCSSFSYCAKADNKRCRISSTFMTGIAEPNVIEVDDKCDIFSVKYLDFYDAFPGKVVLVVGDKVFKSVATTEECAKNCRTEKQFTCRGFEFCNSQKTCVLHTTHVLDLKEGDSIDTKGNKCTHYSAKFSADYTKMGNDLIVDEESENKNEITLEECARICSEQFIECNSFNFCPASEIGATDSTCSLSTKTLKSGRIKTVKKENCAHYSKKDEAADWSKSQKQEINTEGWTTKGFTGLVLVMLALGVILGVLGFVGYSYMRSKSSDESMTVRFMKQADT